ncbi:HAD-IIIC family phosphatase [Clostridium tyrobutyricum]|uniref:HAD-IIIC family phosphatase n=1 Tax=Clostridium tyrobutyricum TaxID=1519 RepID=UPI001C386C6F|nr:HAD-IIIC family phosphatase [Clostridium tyrobutyricum]MBV4430583.1 HAD-IIIC family phosphatase [Clostridium tyrobutyricum]
MNLNEKTINYHINKYKKIQKNGALKKCSKKIKIAFLSSFTTKFLKETLISKCFSGDISVEFYECDYCQYAQDIINENSEFYSFNPDLTILFIDIQSLLGDFYFIPNKIDDNGRIKLINEKFDYMKQLIETIKSRLKTKIIVHNFKVPIYSPFGILDEKQDFGFIESIEKLNYKLRRNYKKDTVVYIFDYDGFCSKFGKVNLCDNKMYYLADVKLKFDYIPYLCDEYIKYIKPMMSLSRKCIVLDLDNTLWGGIVGEVGSSGIKLGPTPEDRPFYEFQKCLLALNKRGVILALNSKNNYEDAMKVVKNNPYMVLREKNFASIKVNWNDKASNINEIAKEINIGLDSIVFIDDDKFNIDMVRNLIPQVNSICLPDDPAQYVDVLKNIDDFNILQFTKEDMEKSTQYYYQRKRSEMKKDFYSIDDYLKALDMKVEVYIDDYNNISRISQMTQKTNQFNLTTKRYFEEDIKKFMSSNNYKVISFRVKDRFSDNGIVAVVIINMSRNIWTIDTFLMSCRVIGRRIEDVIIKTVIDRAKESSVKLMKSEFIQTVKNKLVEKLYDKYNFVKRYEKEGSKEYIYDFSKNIIYPDYIDVKLNK